MITRQEVSGETHQKAKLQHHSQLTLKAKHMEDPVHKMTRLKMTGYWRTGDLKAKLQGTDLCGKTAGDKLEPKFSKSRT